MPARQNYFPGWLLQACGFRFRNKKIVDEMEAIIVQCIDQHGAQDKKNRTQKKEAARCSLFENIKNKYYSLGPW